jgi:hypothetical protein
VNEEYSLQHGLNMHNAKEINPAGNHESVPPDRLREFVRDTDH